VGCLLGDRPADHPAVFADLPAASEPSVGDAPMTMRSPDERHGRKNMRQTWGSSARRTRIDERRVVPSPRAGDCSFSIKAHAVLGRNRRSSVL
jgi:hypothetical protein